MTDLATTEPTLPPLASVADVEDFTGPLADDDIARVGRWLVMASAAVRRFTRQTLSLVVDDEVVVPSSGTTLIVLAQRPVRVVSSVVVRYSWRGWADQPALPEAFGGWAEPGVGRFTWDAYGRLTRLDGMTWGTRFDPVAVTYTHGWDPVPADVVGLVAAKVANFITGQGANPEGLKSLQVGAMSQTFSNSLGSEAALGPGGLTNAEEDALADYRQRAFAVDIGAQ